MKLVATCGLSAGPGSLDWALSELSAFQISGQAAILATNDSHAQLNSCRSVIGESKRGRHRDEWAPAFASSGTIEEWKQNVAAPAAGNTRLVFRISVSFAGTLLDIVGETSGGFHLRGNSSLGKTTALELTASVRAIHKRRGARGVRHSTRWKG